MVRPSRRLMMAGPTGGWPRLVLALVLVLLSLGPAGHADAARLRFRAYGESDGLWNMTGRCLVQAGAGYLLVCSEAGVFAYDGRRFENLGPAQGLISGGLVREIAIASTGRVAVRYSDRLFVSDQAIALDRPPDTLHFHAVDLGAQADPDLWQPHRLAPWKDGFAIALGRRLMRVALSPRRCGARADGGPGRGGAGASAGCLQRRRRAVGDIRRRARVRDRAASGPAALVQPRDLPTGPTSMSSKAPEPAFSHGRPASWRRSTAARGRSPRRSCPSRAARTTVPPRCCGCPGCRRATSSRRRRTA